MYVYQSEKNATDYTGILIFLILDNQFTKFIRGSILISNNLYYFYFDRFNKIGMQRAKCKWQNVNGKRLIIRGIFQQFFFK